jgi:uncharacterized protein YbbC (DUF1343 family)/CubicO group peptidase (beta-lactamase class C family)
MKGLRSDARGVRRLSGLYQMCSFLLILLPSLPLAAGGSSPFERIDTLIAKAIARQELPGCVVVIIQNDQVVHERAFGRRQIEPVIEPMTVDTVFDLASLTKPVATASSIMRLVQQGEIRLRDPVSRYLPEFQGGGKDRITIEHLLTHQGGFVPDSPLAEYLVPTEIWPKLLALQPVHDPGTKFVYSDVGFQLLGRIVESVAKKSLADFANEEIFIRLGMQETGYLPREELRLRAAPAERRQQATTENGDATSSQEDLPWIRGEVHDPRAYAMGGIAGHAGLFSTARDLTRYARMMLREGSLDGVQIFAPQTVRLMTKPNEIEPGIFRGQGWDIRSPYSINRGDLMSARAFGHGGFTGTGMWIDPEHQLAVIFLSNRLHPDGKGIVNPLIGAIGSLAVVAASGAHRGDGISAPTAPGEVDTGIDVLVKEKFQRLNGKRIGLITNHTGIDREGHSTIERIHRAEGVQLVKLFSPEHGLRGDHDQPDIPDEHDNVTGVPIFSLYGSRQAPTSEMLSDLDVLIFDIQDIGTRFYTYISTMGRAMQAAGEAKIKFMVLDRPNPVGGRSVEGPVLDAGLESFVGFHTIPIRHGLTVGELAQMIRSEQKISVNLEVVSMQHWERSMPWDATGLPWVNPSPNMRSLRQAYLYPGIGILETTNLSVGRGTDTPFEMIGAPWINGKELAASLRTFRLPGVVIIPREFRPEASKFAGETCDGVEFIVTDRDRFEAVKTGFAVALTLRKLYPDKWDRSNLNRLLGDTLTRDAIESGMPLDALMQLHAEELDEFITRSKAYRIYR